MIRCYHIFIICTLIENWRQKVYLTTEIMGENLKTVWILQKDIIFLMFYKLNLTAKYVQKLTRKISLETKSSFKIGILLHKQYGRILDG